MVLGLSYEQKLTLFFDFVNKTSLSTNLRLFIRVHAPHEHVLVKKQQNAPYFQNIEFLFVCLFEFMPN